MGRITVDFSKTQDFEAIPPGDYEVIIESVKHGLSQSSGEPTLKWALAVAEGEYEGRKLFLNTSLQAHALFRLKAICESMGMASDELMEMEYDDSSNEVIQPQFAGRAAIAKVSVDPKLYNNRKQNRIDDLRVSEAAGAGGNSSKGRRLQ